MERGLSAAQRAEARRRYAQTCSTVAGRPLQAFDRGVACDLTERPFQDRWSPGQATTGEGNIVVSLASTIRKDRQMTDLPDSYERMRQVHPEVMRAYESLGEAAKKSGPLDARSAALVKLALGLAGGLEGGSHSAVRKALEAGCTPDELRHVAVLAVTTLGFPAMMRARAWVEDVLSGAA
jgi:alkylhydroperoxidase/carboxymuconolactone decarboxylase family protein YurZ